LDSKGEAKECGDSREAGNGELTRALVILGRRRCSLIEEKQGFASLGESEARLRLERGWVFLGLAHER
jgi:hypothetical protein